MLARPHPQRRRATTEHVQRQAFHLDRQNVSGAVVSFVTHMLAPTSYLQCVSSPSYHYADFYPHEYKIKQIRNVMIDEAIVVMDEEVLQDGGPLCREATIASWKAKPCRKERRRSLEWLSAMLKRDFAEKDAK